MANFLFSTHSNEELAGEILRNQSRGRGTRLKKGKCIISHYKDGEILVHIDEKVKGKKVYVLGSTFPPAENMLELIILINALKANGAGKIIALIPYFGYGKQDRIKYSGDAMSAKLMVRIIEDAGASEIVALDLHSQQVAEYFRVPITELQARAILAEAIKKLKLKNLVVLAPDLGADERSKKFADELGIKNLANVEKHRPKVDEAKITKFTGEVKNKNVVIVDDLSQTGGTLIAVAKFLKAKGAKDIYVALTHLVATGPVVANLRQEKNIKKIFTTNSIVRASDFKKDKKFVVLSVAELFGKSIN
ncbi:ribose-phosphate pyrophosphokinase [Candidatus Kuenenbacteria bacterium]|nr:ribose-phosphate pyrophosphokinase [Candidatus Kuenenbacteria bacterium]